MASKRSLINLLVVVGMGLVVMSVGATTTWAAVIVQDFEDGTIGNWGEIHCPSCDHAVSVVNDPLGINNYVGRFEHQFADFTRDDSYIDSDDKKAMIWGPGPVYHYDTVEMGREYWYGFRVLIPDSFPTQLNWFYFAQWHGWADEGEASRSPALGLKYVNDEFWVELIYSSTKIQSSNNGTVVRPYISSKYAERGKWHDFVVHVRWSYENDGRLEVWIDGNQNQVVNYQGPIGYNDDRGPWFLFGIYRSPVENQGDTVIYTDDYKRGWSYEDVDPGGTVYPTVTPTPTLAPGCQRSNGLGNGVEPDPGWINHSITPSFNGDFIAKFGLIPEQMDRDGLVGFSLGAGDYYTDYAMLVRFNDQGNFDVRDGDVYRADQVIRFDPGKTYQVKLEADTNVKYYSVWITSPGGSEVPLASDYHFRTEQSQVNQIDNWAIWSRSGTFQLCNLQMREKINWRAYLINWLSLIGDQNGDGKVNTIDWEKVVGGQ